MKNDTSDAQTLLKPTSASFLGWIVSFNLFKNADADFLLQLGSGVSDVRI